LTYAARENVSALFAKKVDSLEIAHNRWILLDVEAVLDEALQMHNATNNLKCQKVDVDDGIRNVFIQISW
jgi:hypothetical protein